MTDDNSCECGLNFGAPIKVLTPEEWRHIAELSKEAAATIAPELPDPELMASCLVTAANIIIPTLVNTCESLHAELASARAQLAADEEQITRLEAEAAELSMKRDDERVQGITAASEAQEAHERIAWQLEELRRSREALRMIREHTLQWADVAVGGAGARASLVAIRSIVDAVGVEPRCHVCGNPLSAPPGHESCSASHTP